MRGRRHGRRPRRAADRRLIDDLVPGITAAAWAQQQTAAGRDDPGARIALVERSYRGPFGQAPRHLPYRRAAMSFMLPDEYPLTGEVNNYLSNELGFGRLLDYGVIVPRLQQLYEWSAHELGAPGFSTAPGTGEARRAGS
jgi:hypothetical protein